jgi:predicted MPP superfamily phosphohydrolase
MELARWIDLVNAEKPDLVLIAGDIIDMSMRPLVEENMAEELRRIEAPVYACLGNHEYYSGEPEAQRFYQEAGIHLLRDTSAVVGDLCLLGRDDRSNLGRKDVAAIVRDADMQKYTILLDHQPYHLERTERAGIDFQFSGHTHHGQVWPISWITDAIYECAFGPHQRGNTRYYVSSGIGIWGGKFRIGTRSEYVVATLDNQE